MTDNSLSSLQAEYQRLQTRLKEPLEAADRQEIKSEIVALFNRTETCLAQYSEFKESIRALIDQFKAIQPEPSGQPESVRHDHIGASTFVERGWTALAGADWKQAEILLRNALRLDRDNTAAASLLGWSLMHQGRNDEALQRCLDVLVRQPEHGMARTTVGAICLRKGITGEAIEHLSRVLRSAGDPRASLYARYWLGVAYLEREMLTDAVEVLNQAVARAPNLAEAWAELGRALWLMDRHEEARSAWHRGADMRHSPFAFRAVQLLQAADAGEVVPRSPLA